MKTILTVALATLAAGLAHADDNVPLDQGWRAGIGGAYIHINSKSDDFSGRFSPPDLSLNVKSTSTLFLSLSKRLSDHIDIELLGGLPPLHRSYAKGASSVGSLPYNGVEIGSSRQFAPTVIINYNLFDPGTALRPYIGAGFNYTHFYDRKTTAAGDSINGGATSVALSDSLGPAVQIGLRYQATEHVSLNASLVRPIVQSQLTATTDGIARTIDINFNPLVSIVSLEYAY